LECFIGDLVDKFAVLCYKYRNKWDKISDTIKTCMALQNINTKEHIVREYIYKVNPLQWEDMLEEKKHWLSDKLISILNEVIFL